jgi:tetratricopeptide (TPR) repeat protein
VKLDEVLLKLGWLTLKGGDFAAAEEFFARALERFPEGYKPKDSLYALARIYQKNGKYTKAEQAYTKLLEYVETDSPEAEKVIAFIAQVKQLQN